MRSAKGVAVDSTSSRGDRESNEAQLRDVARIMGAPVSWAPDLPLKAEGWTDYYFKKD